MPAIDAFQIREEPICFSCGDMGDCPDCGTADDDGELDSQIENMLPCMGTACVNPAIGHRYAECITVEMMDAIEAE